jgi:hypothetical protein
MTECKSTMMDLKKKIDVDSRQEQSIVDWITNVSGQTLDLIHADSD